MKIRSGFVSNSSSSSYVILIKDVDSFVTSNIESIIENALDDNEYDGYFELSEEAQQETNKKIIDEFKKELTESIRSGSCSGYDDDNIYSILSGLDLKKYTLARAAGGPDDGCIVFVTLDKVKGIVENG